MLPDGSAASSPYSLEEENLMEMLELEGEIALSDILHNGGRPGFDYALVSPNRLNDLKSDNWDIVIGAPPMEYNGQSAILMGVGEAIVGASPQATTPRFWIDENLTGAAPAASVPGTPGPSVAVVDPTPPKKKRGRPPKAKPEASMEAPTDHVLDDSTSAPIVSSDAFRDVGQPTGLGGDDVSLIDDPKKE
jgi:hypothetical protein